MSVQDVQDAHADCRKQIHDIYDEAARTSLRRSTVKQVIQSDTVLAVIHVEAAEDGLIIYVK